MTSSAVTSNPITNNVYGPLDSLKQVKKSKIQRRSGSVKDPVTENKNEITLWRSEIRQDVYRSKLLQALQQVPLGSGGSVHSARLRGRAVRQAADRVLALTAKGRSRWSRAILTNQLKNKSMKSDLKRRGEIASAKRNIRLTKPRVGVLRLKTKNLPTVEQKARDLRRLVPGCRKQPLPVVLEEVTDYISALGMQVKVMAAVADLFSERLNSGSGFVAGAVNVSPVGVSR